MPQRIAEENSIDFSLRFSAAFAVELRPTGFRKLHNCRRHPRKCGKICLLGLQKAPKPALFRMGGGPVKLAFYASSAP
jgi:hypothetical protein